MEKVVTEVRWLPCAAGLRDGIFEELVGPLQVEVGAAVRIAETLLEGFGAGGLWSAARRVLVHAPPTT